MKTWLVAEGDDVTANVGHEPGRARVLDSTGRTVDELRLKVFSTRTGARVAHVAAARKFGWNIAVSYDGDRVAVVLDDGVVTVWDVPG